MRPSKWDFAFLAFVAVFLAAAFLTDRANPDDFIHAFIVGILLVACVLFLIEYGKAEK